MPPRPEPCSAKGSSTQLDAGAGIGCGDAVTDALGRGRLVSTWTASIFILSMSGLSRWSHLAWGWSLDIEAAVPEVSLSLWKDRFKLYIKSGWSS